MSWASVKQMNLVHTIQPIICHCKKCIISLTVWKEIFLCSSWCAEVTLEKITRQIISLKFCSLPCSPSYLNVGMEINLKEVI